MLLRCRGVIQQIRGSADTEWRSSDGKVLCQQGFSILEPEIIGTLFGVEHECVGRRILGSHAEVILKIALAESDVDILACFPVMRHLRDLPDSATFLQRVRSQQLSGYQLAVLRDGEELVAAAGFRLGESLAWGRHLYVDDFVTLPEARSRGYGAALLTWLSEYGRSQRAGELHLDSGKQRVDAHRFYEREGLVASGFHFNRSV